MIKITEENIEKVGHNFDYELENGVLLHESEWNGEKYITKSEGAYKPIYKEVGNDEFEIIGFEISY